MYRLFSILAALSLAGQLSALTVSLDGIPSRVRSSNPDLAAARLRIEEAKGRLLGAGRLSNPEAGAAFKHDKRFEEGTIELSFDQRFPVTARLRIEKVLSAKLVEAAELEVRDRERLTIAEAQVLAIKLLAIDQQAALRTQQVQLANKLSTFATDRAAKGEISALDAAQAQVDSQRLLLESKKLEAERVGLVGELKPKLGVSASNNLEVTGPLPKTALPGTIPWQRRADYQLALVNEQASLMEIDLARTKKWDDITAGVMWEGERMEDAPDGLERTGFFGFRVSIPLPFWNKNQGEIAEKTASATRAVLETKALASDITNQAAAARADMAANARLASDTKETLLPLVLEQTSKLEKAYEGGQVDLFTVLRAREQRLQLEVAVIDATRDFHLARIRYESATGKHAPATVKPASSSK